MQAVTPAVAAMTPVKLTWLLSKSWHDSDDLLSSSGIVQNTISLCLSVQRLHLNPHILSKEQVLQVHFLRGKGAIQKISVGREIGVGCCQSTLCFVCTKGTQGS